MRTKSSELLENLGMRQTQVEGPMCLWSPENNRLISGYRNFKKRLRKSNKE